MEKQPTHSSSQAGYLTRHTSGRITIALVITLAFVGIEAAAGILGNSLALLSDAGHNLTDAIALGLSWYTVRLSTRPSDNENTYGYHRSGILVALINSTTLVFVAGYIFFEAYQRFKAPPEVDSGILIAVGFVALLVNAGTAWLLYQGSQHDLNLRSAYVHLMGDVFSTLGAIAAGILIALTGLNWLDPLVSVLIGLLILWNAWGILEETISILMERTPGDVDLDHLVSSLMRINGVKGVHDLHVWSINQSLRALSAHILTDDISISRGAVIQKDINEILRSQYSIGHATLQLESMECEPDHHNGLGVNLDHQNPPK